MQDNFSKILKKENISINLFEPFSQISIDFLLEFSKELKKNKRIYTYPNLIYLMLWCNKKKIEKFKNNFKDHELRLGRGLAFHICPSNVPTNFIYSFFIGLLSGNSNIVKIPSKNFEEKNIIISTIKKLFSKKKFRDLEKSNTFIQYKNNEDAERTKQISSISDCRIIWGGDKTINEIKKIWSPERTVDITFPDRYSFSLINLNVLKKLKSNEIDLLVKKFYYDSYSMNQLACNSPHFVFWSGKINLKLQNYFWNKLNSLVKKKFHFDDIHVLEKYSNLIENIIYQSNFEDLKRFKNNLYVINPNKRIHDIENIRGINGTFFQKNISEINKLSKFITKKCQTISYFGFNKEELRNFMTKNNLLGVDRIVPVGQSLDFDINWDGYETIKILSRVVSIR